MAQKKGITSFLNLNVVKKLFPSKTELSEEGLILFYMEMVIRIFVDVILSDERIIAEYQ
jgi:hypothetical protein